MADTKWTKLSELQQPGLRRILDALRTVEEESPGLLERVTVAATELSKSRGEGGQASG
jgi:hypothetical protein